MAVGAANIAFLNLCMKHLIGDIEVFAIALADIEELLTTNMIELHDLWWKLNSAIGTWLRKCGVTDFSMPCPAFRLTSSCLLTLTFPILRIRSKSPFFVGVVLGKYAFLVRLVIGAVISMNLFSLRHHESIASPRYTIN